MADIDVVKKGSTPWVWIIGLLAAVVLLWLLWSSMRSDAGARTGEERGDSSSPVSTLVAARTSTHLSPA